jgi:hypothetical protein
MSHFWSSTTRESYIEPKFNFQAIGITDFVQPFLIQSMTKPAFSTISSGTVKKILKNGTIRTENHYKNDYTLNTIQMKIIDAYDQETIDNLLNTLNKSQTIFDMLTAGGWTLASNDRSKGALAQTKGLLRMPNLQILELVPHAKSDSKRIANAVASAVSDIVGDIMNGDFNLGSLAETASTAVNYLGDNVAGVWTMESPIITQANFGSVEYSSANFTQITLSFKYNNFKYEKSLF